MKKDLDFKLVANNDRYIAVQVVGPDGAPEPIAGFAIRWQVFKRGDSTPLITKSTVDNTISIENADAGLFSFWINAADTKDLAAGEYIHEAVTVDALGHPVTLTNNDPSLSAGRMTLREQYTAQD